MNLSKQFIILSLISLFWLGGGAYLTYDTGDITIAVYPTSTCVNTPSESPRSQKITFSGQFAKKPKFIAYIKSYDTAQTNPISYSFQYTLPQLNETMAQISIFCLTNKNIYGITYTWVAFDDIRITVLDSGMIDTTSLQSQTFTYTHNNIYATTGFITQLGFGYSGSFDFSLKVTNVTSSKVAVSFMNDQNLVQIGFQVIIGPAEAFTVKQLTSDPITSTKSFYQEIDYVANNILLIPLSGLKWTYTSSGARYQLTFTPQASNMRYDLKAWSQTQLASVSYSEVWFNTKNYKVRDPFLCSKMRVTKKQQLDISIPLQLYVAELSKTYYVGDYEILKLDPGTLLWNLFISVRCKQSIKLLDGW